MALSVCLTRGAESATEGQKVTVVGKWQGQLVSDPQMFRQQHDSTTEMEPMDLTVCDLNMLKQKGKKK